MKNKLPGKKTLRLMGVFTILLLLCQFSNIPAHSLTIDEAVSVTLKENKQLKKFRYLSLSQNETMKSKKSEFYPQAELSYNLTREEKDVFFSGRTTSVGTAEITYNLFRGFTDRANLNAEKHRFKAQKFLERAVQADVILDLKQSFIAVLKGEKNLAVAKEAVDLLTSQRRDVALRYREGLIAKNDLLKVELDLSSARQDLLSKKSDLVIARKKLERVMGRKIAEDEILVVPAPGKIKIQVNEEQTRVKMHQGRSEIKYLKSLLLSKKSELASIKGEYYPSIDLSASYTRLGDTLVPSGREGLFVIDESLQGKVTASWDIFDGFRKRHEKASKIMDMRSVEEDIRDTEREIDLQLDRALEGYRINSGNLEVSKKAVAQAEENYRITNQQFKQNISTNTDLLDARVFLSRARTQHINALYDLFLSISEIERVVEAPLEPIKGK